jgi:hypothetical protein
MLTATSGGLLYPQASSSANSHLVVHDLASHMTGWVGDSTFSLWQPPDLHLGVRGLRALLAFFLALQPTVGRHVS